MFRELLGFSKLYLIFNPFKQNGFSHSYDFDHSISLLTLKASAIICSRRQFQIFAAFSKITNKA